MATINRKNDNKYGHSKRRIQLQQDQQPVKPKIALTAMHHRVNEGLLVIIAAISLYLLLALITYNYTDPSWVTTGGHIVTNAGGRIGAQLASILLSLLGYPAYISPLLLIALAWQLYRRQWSQQEKPYYNISMLLSLCGFIIIFVTICGLSDALLVARINLVPMGAGGILGSSISLPLFNTLSKFGTILFFIALLLAGLTLFIGISWINVSKAVLKAMFSLSRLLKNMLWNARRDKEIEQPPNIDKKTDALEETPSLILPRIKLPATNTAPNTASFTPINRHKTIKKVKPKSSKLSSPRHDELPNLDLLDVAEPIEQAYQSEEKLTVMSKNLEQHLAHFNIDAKVVGVEPGPVVTRFEVDLAPGMKVNKVTNVDKDLARAMSTASVRVVEVIPGKSFIGIEIPNEHRDIVNLRELLLSESYCQLSSPLTLALGKNISGHPVAVDLQKMPHLLVAGTTGSGKSVSLNSMILSMLFKSTPEQLRMIMIDPKMLELSVYKDIPHLLAPVVTDMKEASNALHWCIVEMERRYRLMSKLGVRNLVSLNQKIEAAIKEGEPLNDPLIDPEEQAEAVKLESLPYIVVIIDELADMMMTVGKKVEQFIARIAQKARAAGIHMIIATQRPSVDVITGLIKANIPSRVAFSVSSRVDSRTILDQQGAHQLLGYGDMLFLPPGTSIPMRVHAPFVSDDEIHRVVDALRANGEPEYIDAVLASESSDISAIEGEGGNEGGEKDPLYDQAVAIVLETKRASISLVQRRLRIGYNRAANILEAMEAAGLVSAMQANGSREVLVQGEN